MKTLGIIGRIVLALGMCLSLPASRGQAQPYLQTDDPQAKAEALLAEMTPEERVGQLFLVTFDGNQFDSTSAISSLISRYHVGGVVLTAANDNFVDGDGTVSAAHHLTESLQRIEWDITHPSGSESDPAQPASGAYIPLLIGVSQNGDGYPNDQILDGLTPLPSLMSIGATWQTALAERVGRTLGRELEALGINLLLGPSLDVLDPQYGGDGGGLGANTFGSDPYWTQELGKEYISGIHVGGQGRLAVVAKHFPGQGGSDRNPETEVATVRKSLEQLKQIELAPFLAVTSNPQNTSTIADGFLVSHIRYQGFQGNIRETTRPVSLDKSAVDELMALPEFLNWHQSGGVLISDNLGSQSVRRFYDTIGQAFDSRLVARDAFLAGNDLLYVDDFISGTDPDSFTSITKTLDYFTTKYRDDPAFAQRVDDSVRRILTLKYRLYPSFEIDQVLPDEKNLGFIKNSNDVTLDVARNAVTLISPTTASDLESLIAAPPSSSDRILFITDTLTGVQCSTCMTSSGLTVDALQSAVLRLYGPGAGGQVNEGRLVSYSFEDLINVLNYVESPTNEPYPLESDLQRAQWVIFSALNETNDRPASQALRRLLSERPDLLRNKHVIVFSFNTPNILDATDIAKITAYYALYSKTPAFLDVAARVLFHELTPVGASPVSVPGIGYDIIQATAPKPDQVIPLSVDSEQLAQTTPLTTDIPGITPTPAVTVEPTFKVNDVIPVKAGPIMDTNGHLVPDNTVVRFSFLIDGGRNGSMTIDAVTTQGIARTTYTIDRPGMLQISAASDPAKSSATLLLNISEDAGAPAIVITPTMQVTETATPTATVTPSPTPTATPTAGAAASPRFTDWMLAMLLIGLCGMLVYFGSVYRGSVRWGVRLGLCTILGGLAAYSLLAILVPRDAGWLQTEGTGRVLLVTLVGIVVGLGGGLAWRVWLDRMAVRPSR